MSKKKNKTKDSTKSTIFTEAWKMANAAVKRFGGKAREYFRDALSQTWATHKRNQQNIEYFNKCLDYIYNQIAFWSLGGVAGVTSYNTTIINAYEKMYEILVIFQKNRPLDYGSFIKAHQKEIMRVLSELEEWQIQYHHLSDAGGVVEEFYEIFNGRFDRNTATPEETARHDLYVQVDNELSAASAELLDQYGIS